VPREVMLQIDEHNLAQGALPKRYLEIKKTVENLMRYSQRS
jgi:hypothetical protein